MKRLLMMLTALGAAAGFATDKADWYRDGKLGMFIHWGLYSVAGHGEWAQVRDGVPSTEYAKTAKSWKPDLGCEREWVEAAKSAGIRYIVLTTRHHDGFSLFDSKSKRARGCDYMSTMSPARRDHVRAYADACRAAGIKVGFYYSLCDWSFKENPTADYPEASLPLMKQQAWDEIRQLMTDYGKIDILWYDGGHHPDGMTVAEYWDSTNLNAMVRSLQPDILINNRSGVPGDFGTLEGRNIIKPPEDLKLWELCLTLQDDDWSFWGFCTHSFIRKTPEQMACMCMHCLETGGNFLMNVSPDGKGHLPAWQCDLLKQFGHWVETHREGIYGTRATAIATAYHTGNGWTGNSCSFFTRKGNKLYGFLHAWPGTESRYPYFRARIKKATYRGQPLVVEQDYAKHSVTFKGFPAEPPADDWSPLFEVEIEESAVRIADGKHAWADIVIAENASRASRFAAQELKRHLDQLTGADFQIVNDSQKTSDRYPICVGLSKLTKLKKSDLRPQQWAQAFEPDHAELVGFDSEGRDVPLLESHQGTLHAVYEFLEKECGVRWGNGVQGDWSCPKLRKIDVDYKKVYNTP